MATVSRLAWPRCYWCRHEQVSGPRDQQLHTLLLCFSGAHLLLLLLLPQLLTHPQHTWLSVCNKLPGLVGFRWSTSLLPLLLTSADGRPAVLMGTLALIVWVSFIHANARSAIDTNNIQTLSKYCFTQALLACSNGIPAAVEGHCGSPAAVVKHPLVAIHECRVFLCQHCHYDSSSNR